MKGLIQLKEPFSKQDVCLPRSGECCCINASSMRVDRLLQTIPGDALRGPGARVAARGLLWNRASEDRQWSPDDGMQILGVACVAGPRILPPAPITSGQIISGSLSCLRPSPECYAAKWALHSSGDHQPLTSASITARPHSIIPCSRATQPQASPASPISVGRRDALKV